jgi:hypothetical protein
MLLVAACTTTSTRLAEAVGPKPAAGSKVLIVRPDVELSLLTAVGMQEPRADWTAQGRDNLGAELKSATAGRSLQFRELDPAKADDEKVLQLLRLHEAVGQSIMAFNYGYITLPTKDKKTLDWTLGQGAQALGQAYDADYALFTYGRGSYSSAGRKAMMVAGALLGVGVPLGGQTAFASLVDLKTGRVVWFNVARAGPQADMRDAEGAKLLVSSLLEKAPL